MRTMGQIYLSFIWGTAVAVALFQINWLEMRVNMGLVLFAAAGLLFILCTAGDYQPTFLHICISLLLIIGTGLPMLGGERLTSLPALIIREGLGLTRADISSVKGFLLVFFVLGPLISAADFFRASKN